MQIRPGLSLLQALSRVQEPKAVPFAERLAELRGETAVAAKPAATDGGAAAAPAPATREAAPSPGRPAKARGSRIDILV